MPTPQIRLGQALRRWREAAGLKQESLATALGLKNRSSVSQWERGLAKPDLTTLPALAVQLGVSFRTLLELWWAIELPPIGTAEGRLLASRAARLSPEDRQRLTTLIDLWVRPRDEVEAFVGERLRHLVQALVERRAAGLEEAGEGS